MTDIKTINYQPLEAERHAYWIVFKQRLWLYGVIMVLAVAALRFSVDLGVIIFMGVIFYVGMLAAKYRNQVWQNFAAANGWPLDTQTSLLALRPPSLQFGRNEIFSPIIFAQLNDVACDLFAYNTTVGSGKSSHTYYFTVARVALPKALPHIVLEAKKGSATNRPTLANHETLSLEGDFNEYFSLQLEKGQEVDVLSIITPDVMQTLISYSQKEDIEIYSKELYFILRNDSRVPEQIHKLIESVVALSGQIVEYVRLTTVADLPPDEPPKVAAAFVVQPAVTVPDPEAQNVHSR